MTRRLRPPTPLQVHCHPPGTPVSVRRGGRERPVTHIAARWVCPAQWWADEGGDREGVAGERAYHRIVVDGTQILEVFVTQRGTWYLERIID